LVLKAVPEWIQPYEKIGGFKLPLRENILLQRCECAKLFCGNGPKIVGGFNLPPHQTILLQCCQNRARL